MNIRHVTLAAFALTLAGCGGGGGASSTPPAQATAAPRSPGSFVVSLAIPRTSAWAARQPKFVSPSTGSFAIYDGATLVYVANVAVGTTPQFTTVYAASGPTTVTPGTCTPGSNTVVCTLTVTTTVGTHTFDVIAYPVAQSGSPPAFAGVISSEGEIAVNLSPGTNPGATLTMQGVADQVVVTGPSSAAYNVATPLSYRIEDSTGTQIVQPGNFDNGPVTITAAPAGVVTIAPSSFTTPPATPGDQTFDLTCVNVNGGAVTIAFNAGTVPDATYASGLTYSTANYAPAVIASFGFTCNAATGTVPITVEGTRR